MNLQEVFEFTEWAGRNYNYTGDRWIYKYADPSSYDNYRTTREIYELWKIVRDEV